MADRVVIERVDPKDPDLIAKIHVKPPLAHPDADPDSYKAKQRDAWTLANLERTCLELRAAGAWDDSLVNFDYHDGGTVECEILAMPGPDVLPWGWVPRHGPVERVVPARGAGASPALRPRWEVVNTALLTALLVIVLAVLMAGVSR